MVTVTSSVRLNAAGTLITLVVGARSAGHELLDGSYGSAVTVRRLLAGTVIRVGRSGHPELPHVTTAISSGVIQTAPSCGLSVDTPAAAHG